MKRILLLLGMILLLACGCAKPETAPPEASITPHRYTSPAIYFLTDSGVQAVDSEGRIIDIDNPHGIDIASGTLTDSLTIDAAADGSARAVLDYPLRIRYMAMPVRAQQSEAAQVYARRLLDNLLANGGADAIWDYTLTDVSVVHQQGGRLDFLMTYDLRVARNATAYSGYSPFSGKYGQGTTLTGQKRAVTIYGAGGQWMSRDAVYFGDRERLDAPRYADFTPKEGQTALFATERAIYYAEKTATADGHFAATLWAQSRPDGASAPLSAALPDTELRFIDYQQDKLYFGSYHWLNEHESSAGPLYMLDEQTQRWETLLDETVLVLGTAEEAIYVLRQEQDTPPALYALPQATAQPRMIGPLPEEGSTYGLLSINHGKLRLMYNDAPKRVYEIDLTDGTSRLIETSVWS